MGKNKEFGKQIPLQLKATPWTNKKNLAYNGNPYFEIDCLCFTSSEKYINRGVHPRGHQASPHGASTTGSTVLTTPLVLTSHEATT